MSVKGRLSGLLVRSRRQGPRSGVYTSVRIETTGGVRKPCASYRLPLHVVVLTGEVLTGLLTGPGARAGVSNRGVAGQPSQGAKATATDAPIHRLASPPRYR